MLNRGLWLKNSSVLKAVDCEGFSMSGDDRISIISEPGQDMYNIPNLHVANSLARCVMEVSGDFTLRATCQVLAHAKYDGAGLYYENSAVKVKFGVESYGEGSPRIVTVKLKEYSDEASGSLLKGCKGHLILTKKNDIVTCYSEQEGRIRFERAFYEKDGGYDNIIGFYVQSPFSIAQVTGIFTRIALSANPIDHIRV